VELSAVVASVVAWLRKGYPEGLPVGDYVPLFALLARRLSEEEVAAVAEKLANEAGPSSRVAISEAIMGVTYELPSEADIARVSERLIAGGWPVEVPPET
jgi:hypothetical protein